MHHLYFLTLRKPQQKTKEPIYTIKFSRHSRNQRSRTIFKDSDSHISFSSLYFIIDILFNYDLKNEYSNELKWLNIHKYNKDHF